MRGVVIVLLEKSKYFDDSESLIWIYMPKV